MSRKQTSRLKGFYNLPREARASIITEQAELTSEQSALLRDALGLSVDTAEHMIENVIGVYGLPLGIATNFVVNGQEVLVPMVIEEPSVVAGASLAAKLARAGGGFIAETDPPVMIGQIQLIDVPDANVARDAILAERETLIALADESDPILVKLGGGARDIEVRIVPSPLPSAPDMVIVHILYDVRDAMGANAVNTACERLAPRLETLSGGRAFLKILSNLADHRLARAQVTIPERALAFGDYSGEAVAQGIEYAWAFAAADPYRATTHNKGVMNGIDAVVLATGNDWRAIEAGAHAYAARNGHYSSLTTWRRDGEDNLVGRIELPLALGTVGGATRVHPLAQTALKILGVQSATELAQIVASVGLAQNFAAIRALATEGIQKGHMSLHARQVAIAAGAEGALISQVADAMVAEGTVRIDRAQELLTQIGTDNAGGVA